MPKLKMKTHKGAVKRFRFTATGKAMRSPARRGHFRRRKALRLLQRLDKAQKVSRTHLRMVRTALPYGGVR
ncbi:MAG: 50S ribosomal protein L35 [Roseiflexaceae bacterium]